jgi:glycosyltransferase involved in cell wall biosynthesis
MAALELMGLGVPIIVPDIPVWREFVSPDYNIFLDPAQPAAEQLAGMNLDAYRTLEHRRALAADTHARFGMAHFKEQLVNLLGG